MEMRVLSVKIVKGSGPDHVMLEVELPETCYPYNGNLTVTFNATKGSGHQYVVENFPGVKIEIMN